MSVFTLFLYVLLAPLFLGAAVWVLSCLFVMLCSVYMMVYLAGCYIIDRLVG